MFKTDGSTWTEEAKLTPSDGASYDFFGRSVALNVNYALVGAFADDDNGSSSGSVYVFKTDGSTWTEEAKLTPSDGVSGDFFGYSVAFNGDYALVGASDDDDDNGSDSGSAYVFVISGTEINNAPPSPYLNPTAQTTSLTNPTPSPGPTKTQMTMPQLLFTTTPTIPEQMAILLQRISVKTTKPTPILGILLI